MVLLIGPPTSEIASARQANRSVRQDVEELMRVESIDRKAALKRVARSRGVSKSQAYRLLLDERDESE
jgi:16S rRNA (cytidine1402-2'-O)-methyltransferase